MLTGKHAPGQPPEKGTRFSDELESSGVVYRKRYWQEEALAAVAQLDAFFKKREKSLTTAAVAWVLRRPEMTAAIVGASRPDQLDATLQASDVTLGDEETAALDALWFALPRQRPAEGPVR
jgi:aryl-alcohol dehydrogenase-like predicted oxidoreductase